LWRRFSHSRSNGLTAMAQSDRDVSQFTTGPGRYHAWLVVAFAAVLAAYIAYKARAVFTPVLIALAIAYMLNPLASYLERRKIPRVLVVIGLYVVLVVILALLLWFAVPAIISQIVDLVVWVNKQIGVLINLISEEYQQSPEQFRGILEKVQQSATDYAGRAFQYFTDTAAAVLSSLWSIINLLILIPLYSFFFLWRFDRIVNAVGANIPEMYRARVITVAKQIDQTVANFFQGRLIVCTIVGVGTAVGYLIAGVPFALPLGLFIGVLNIVPYLAAIVGLPITLLVCYLPEYNLTLVIYAFIAFTVVQLIDNVVLTPVIQGKTVGLHPITTIIVLFIGAELAGLFGLILAVPAAAVVKMLFCEFVLPELTEITTPADKLAPGKTRMAATGGLQPERLDRLADKLSTAIATRPADGPRYLLGIVGYPGGGKSTFAEQLADAVRRRTHPGFAAVVPMDGFHYPNAVLDSRGLRAAKGAPTTFDAHAFINVLNQLRQTPPTAVSTPAYDRTFHEPVADAITIGTDARLVVVEGNYLLMNEPPWDAVRPLLDAVWFLDMPIDQAMQQVRQRHITGGCDPAQAEQRVAANDRTNAQLIAATRHRADKIIPL